MLPMTMFFVVFFFWKFMLPVVKNLINPDLHRPSKQEYLKENNTINLT